MVTNKGPGGTHGKVTYSSRASCYGCGHDIMCTVYCRVSNKADARFDETIGCIQNILLGMCGCVDTVSGKGSPALLYPVHLQMTSLGRCRESSWRNTATILKTQKRISSSTQISSSNT